MYQDDKECAFESKVVDDSIKLLQFQSTLEKDTHQSFIGLSVSETIYKCTIIGQHTKASKIRSEFKVGDKR